MQRFKIGDKVMVDTNLAKDWFPITSKYLGYAKCPAVVVGTSSAGAVVKIKFEACSGVSFAVMVEAVEHWAVNDWTE